MSSKFNPTARQIIDKTIDVLRQDRKVDARLLNILAKHIVTLSPSKTAVDQAVADIEELAVERGNG